MNNHTFHGLYEVVDELYTYIPVDLNSASIT